MSTVEFRSCTRDEAGRLTEIAYAAKRHWGYPESWIDQWQADLTVTPEMIDRMAIRAAVVDGELAGFFILTPQTIPDPLPESFPDGLRAEVDAFWVTPEQIGRGVGRALFEHAVELARSWGVSVLDITSDPHAEGFYARMGARRVGETPAPLRDRERFLPRMEYELGR